MVEPEGPHTIRLMRVACWISKATREQARCRACAPTPTRTQAFTLAHTPKEICNTYCFSTATLVTRTRLCYVIRTFPLLLLFNFTFIATDSNPRSLDIGSKVLYSVYVVRTHASVG